MYQAWRKAWRNDLLIFRKMYCAQLRAEFLQ